MALTAFRAYDVRGVYPREVNEPLAYKLGRALGVFFRAKDIIVGRDCRLSSPALHKALVSGLVAQGKTVVDIGLCSTPMLYFAAQQANAVMITASHGPKGTQMRDHVQAYGLT